MMEAKVLWMTINRHPESLRALIREQLSLSGWKFDEISYESIEKLENLELEKTDAVLLAPARQIPTRYLDRLENCKLMQVWSSGFDKFNLEEAQTRNLRIANNHGANATSVAEQTILLMLGVSRRAPEMHQRVVNGQWDGNDHGMGSYSLNRKTLGIVGMGKIGSLVCSRAQSLGMKVVYFDPYLGPNAAPSGAVKTDWENLLQKSDYISLHVHHNDETRGMIDSSAFMEMARKPFLINCSRAEIIQRNALVQALETGQIRGFGVDAHYAEPTVAEDSLWKFPTVFASPHVAGSTIDSYSETIEACVRNIQRALDGKAPQGLIPAQ